MLTSSILLSAKRWAYSDMPSEVSHSEIVATCFPRSFQRRDAALRRREAIANGSISGRQFGYSKPWSAHFPVGPEDGQKCPACLDWQRIQTLRSCVSWPPCLHHAASAR